MDDEKRKAGQRMTESSSKPSRGCLQSWLRRDEEHLLSLLGSFLDAHTLLQEKGMAGESVNSLFAIWWPKISLAETLRELLRLNLLSSRANDVFAIPEEVRPELFADFRAYAEKHPIKAPLGFVSFEDMVGGFERYAEANLRGQKIEKCSQITWGSSTFMANGRVHHLLRRPYPVRLIWQDQAFILCLCKLPEAGIEVITEGFVRTPGLRQRLALYDTESCMKMNLTRSEVFVWFERYLRDELDVRFIQLPALGRALEQHGILSLRMG